MEDLKTIETVDQSPFKRMCMTIGELPASFVDSMTYYECLAWLVNYLKKTVIPAVNNNAEATEELQSAFVTLKNYVDNYFDNLDVQTEIDNKLDEMADDGTLQEIIEAYLEQLLGNVQYIFPKNYVDENNTQGGDICIIKAFNKVILIDSGSNVYKTEVYDFLARHNISHIDHMIISHYHGDHSGNVINLITDGYIDTTSTVYLAPYCDLLTNYAVGMTNYNNIVSTCSAQGVTTVQPTEGYTLAIDDTFKIKFYNYDRNYLDDTSALTLRDYNNASGIQIIEHLGKKLLFTGDAYEEPIEHLMSNGSISNAFDFVKISHHGVDNGTLNTILYPKLAPQYAFLPANTGYLINNDLARSKYINLYREIGTRIFAQYISNVDCIFETWQNEIRSLSGNVLIGGSTIPLGSELYVDINTDCVDPDGSSTKPFKDIAQAINAVPKGVGNITLRLADGTYCTAHDGESPANLLIFKDVNVSIYGHAGNRNAVHIKNGFNCVNSTVYLENLTVDVTSQKNTGAINANTSNINMKWVDIKGDTNDNTKYHAIRALYSTINLVSVAFNYINRGIYTDFSNVYAQECSFTDCTYGAYVPNGTLYIDRLSYNSGILIYANNVMHLSVKPKTLCGDASGSTTLNDDITRFNKLIVQTGSGATMYTDTIYSYRTGNFAKGATYTAKSLTGTVTIQVDASDGKVVTITASDENVRGLIGCIEQFQQL